MGKLFLFFLYIHTKFNTNFDILRTSPPNIPSRLYVIFGKTVLTNIINENLRNISQSKIKYFKDNNKNRSFNEKIHKKFFKLLKCIEKKLMLKNKAFEFFYNYFGNVMLILKRHSIFQKRFLLRFELYLHSMKKIRLSRELKE